MVSSVVQGLNRTLMPLLDNHHTSSLTYRPCCNVRTKEGSPLTLDSTSSTIKRHFNHAGMSPAVNLKWLSGLIPIQRSNVSFLGGLWFLHLVEPVQQTIWTALSSHWKDVTGSATVLYQMCFASLRRLKYWSWSTWSVMSANLLKHQATWCYSYPFGIAHHSAKLSRVLISGCQFFFIRLRGALIRGISSLRPCIAGFAFSSWYWNSSFGHSFAKSGRRPYDDSIVGTLI